MSEKKCRKCNTVKPLSDYYKHKEMFDGHLNICKECVKGRVGNYRKKNIDRVREYDRNGPNKEQRNEKNKKRSAEIKTKNPKKWEKMLADRREWNKSEFGKKRKYVNCLLRHKVNEGFILKPNYCADCEAYFEDKSILQGHHEDYNNALGVIWLCPKCHSGLHKKYREKERNVDKEIKV